MAKHRGPSSSDSERHLVSLGMDHLLDAFRLTVEPYDNTSDEALTTALEVSWLPDHVVPPASDFTVRRHLQLEEERLDAALADTHSPTLPTEIESFQMALHPQAHGLGYAGLYLAIDNTRKPTNE